MAVGPFGSVPYADGQSADFFMLRYDREGRLLSRRAEAELLESLSDVTDVFVFSHGWNNVFDVALKRYRSFIDGYSRQRRQFDLPAPPDYRPALVGVVWPATSLVLPWESGPAIAGNADGDASYVEEMLTLVTSEMDRDATAELVQLVDGRPVLDLEEARRAADLVRVWLRSDPDDETGAAPPELDEVLDAWAALDETASEEPPQDPEQFGTVGGQGPATGRSGPAAAGGSRWDPRGLLRTATVWKMKDRAGRVGVHGVGPLVRSVLEDCPARVHLLGHSFGARVMLSALVEPPPRSVRSLLLLQPAVNRWCFAPDVAVTHRRGGYNPVLDHVELPVLSTFSQHDTALTKAFHLALRSGHLGEPKVAGTSDAELYGALGGYGPAGLGDLSRTVAAVAPGTGAYPLDGAHRVVAVDGGAAVDGSPAISGHGDISNPTTWWALHCLTRA